MEYMKSQVLKIDLIDESVEMKEGQDDYIGSVRIPLREVLMNEELADNFPVKDAMGRETGRMEIKLTCKDYNAYATSAYQGAEGHGVTLSKFIEKDIITKISEALAEIPYEDMDLMFDFFNQGADPNKIFKKDFKEFILLNLRVRNVKETDLELFLKSSFFLQNKDYIDRNDFRNLFEYHVRETRNKKLEHTAEFQKKYSDAQNFFKTGDRNTMYINT